MKRFLAVILALAMAATALSGCGTLEPNGTSGSSDPSGVTGGNSMNSGSSAEAEDVDFSQNDGDMFTNRDLSGTYEDAKTITLGSGDVSITEAGTYLLTGTLDGGMITVNVTGENDKVQLVLSGASIYSDTGAAICVLDADKVFITLADGTENTVEVGETIETVEGYELNAAIYSRSDLTINGTGSLSVISPAGHGISTKDDLAITGGTISITCANQGIDANDSVRICGGNITVDSGKDGIHAENADDATLGFVYISGGKLDLETEGDGISASAHMQIEKADITVLAGGGYENGSSASSDGWGNMGGGMGGNMGGRPRSSTTSSTEAQSMKGLKAAGGILISSGTFALDSADDAIHSNGSVTINDGTFTLASGDDGIHAEDTLTITACDMTINESYEGLEAAYIYVKGGTIWMNCSDDGLNAAGGTDSSGTGGRDGMFGGMGGGMMSSDYGYIEVSGGSMTIYAGGDGLDSNGDLTISGGYTVVYNPKSGDTSVLDSQNLPSITGGTYVGLGITTSMAEVFSSSSSTQGFIAVSARLSAGTEISFADKDGNVILTCATEYTTQLIIVSCPEMIKGETYTITAGDATGSFAAS